MDVFFGVACHRHDPAVTTYTARNTDSKCLSRRQYAVSFFGKVGAVSSYGSNEKYLYAAQAPKRKRMVTVLTQ